MTISVRERASLHRGSLGWKRRSRSHTEDGTTDRGEGGRQGNGRGGEADLVLVIVEWPDGYRQSLKLGRFPSEPRVREVWRRTPGEHDGATDVGAFVGFDRVALGWWWESHPSDWTLQLFLGPLSIYVEHLRRRRHSLREERRDTR